jgi:HK97 gp10 family phage protein
MAMRTELAGYKETREAMAELTKSVQKNIGKRGLEASARILAGATQQRAPVSNDPYNKTPGSLRASVQVVKHRSKVGAAAAVLVEDPAAVRVEFGRTNQAADPFFRPAIDASEGAMLKAFADRLGPEVEAATRRAGAKSKKAGT